MRVGSSTSQCQVDVEAGGGIKALDQRDGAAVAFISLELGALQQMALDHALHHLQRRRDHFWLRGQRQPQGDRTGIAASERRLTGIIRLDDRFLPTSSADRLSSRDPQLPVKTLNCQPQS
jgi:hypothetical protein